MENLLEYKSNVHSQNGEDGIIAIIFERIGIANGTCCEVGAWDGIHLSNCRHLISQHWNALMIEGDGNRFADLVSTYEKTSVICENLYVDTGQNSLSTILDKNGIEQLDFLSIDIDGLDYEIFEAIDFRPKVICIEVNAAHHPESTTRINRDISKNNIGQPLQVFVEIAKSKNYSLVCYTGNAFFVRDDLVEISPLPVLTSKQAYQNFINDINMSDKEWLFLVNLGIVNPYRKFYNPYLSRAALEISKVRVLWIIPLNIFKTVRAIWVEKYRPIIHEKSMRIRREAKAWIKYFDRHFSS